MKKKRVLALFLAFSMALSSNGFTALAAENDLAVTIEADSSDETDEEIASDESGEIGNGSSASEDGDKTENGSGISGENDGTGTENGSSDENDAIGSGSNSSGETGETGNGSDASDETGEAGNEIEVPDEDDETISDESEETDTVETEDEEDVDDTDLTDEAAPSEDVLSYEPSIRTYTDETGMVVTYDENEVYSYTVVNHVLTKVVKADGTPITGTVALEQLSGEDSYEEIGEDVFNIKGDKNVHIEYVIIPEGVKYIGENAFEGYSELTGISLPVKLEKIKTSAFKNCKNLTRLSVPKSVTEIGDRAFYDDTSLFMVYIKDSAYSDMESIGDYAFYNCRRLEKFGSDTEFLLPGYLESIGTSAFEECRAIKQVVLPDSVVKEQTIVTENPDTQETITSVKHALGENVFKNCIALTDVTLSGTEIIPKHAFDGCVNLLSVKFASGNRTIDEYAFANCSRLGEVIFSYTVNKVCDYAFYGCSQLRYAEFPNAEARIGSIAAFPNTNEYKLWMRGFTCDTTKPENQDLVYTYTKRHNNIEFIAYNESPNAYFKYSYQCLSTASKTVKFSTSDKTTDPNSKNSGSGVKAGEKIYISISGSSSIKLVEGSLRCNGTPISGPDSEGYYVFKMPVGGAYVTAEFESTGKDESKYIKGNANDVKCELSNGNILKIGQTTRMFLIDISAEADNEIIPSYKITFTTNDKKVATVSADGTIKAVKKGNTSITAQVLDRNGKEVYVRENIQVEEADVDSLKLKPSEYDRNIVIVEENDAGEIWGLSLHKEDVERADTTFKLLATAYDSNDDDMSVALKWATSDSKVAKLAKASTGDAEPKNTITIPKGASGEATITVTATNTNPVEPNKGTVTSKFTVRVMDSTPKLSSSTVTLNPYMKDGVTLELISAYGSSIDSNNVAIRKNDNKNAPHDAFDLTPAASSDEHSSILKYNITAANADIKEGNYQACIYVEARDNPYYLPLTIKVKRTVPNPKVKFDSKQPKMNFFYKDGGTEITPIISNLGDVTVSSYALENLSNGTDDSKFTGEFGNFDIDSTTGVITRSGNAMYYTAKKKPVVTGYLVLTFDGFKEGYNEKKIKITIPNKTVKPSYKLERTSDTFKAGTELPPVTLALIDKKTKKPVELDSEWNIDVLATSTTSAVAGADISTDGKIELDVNPNLGAGKAVLSVTNENWDEGEELQFKYTVKISNKKTTFKLSKSSVTLNKYFAGSQTEKITLKTNQFGVEPADTVFEQPEKLSEAKEEQYSKINVGWDSEEKAVTVSLSDSDIKNGSYKFTCRPLGDEGNKVTLTVKVTGSLPKLSLKGSASLNKLAGEGVDTATLNISVKNLPSGCELDADETKGSIASVTKREDDETFESSFNWDIEDNKLKISLADDDIVSKTYNFQMTPSYTDCEIPEEKAKPIKFKVKVYSKAISVSLKAKGKLNLLERYEEEDLIDSEPDALEAYTTELPSYDENAASTSVPVDYVYETEGVEEVELKVAVGESDGAVVQGQSGTMEIDETSNQPKNKYVYTATAKTDDYVIKSINAYVTSNKTEEEPEKGWSDLEPFVADSVVDEETTTRTLTIDTDTVFSEEAMKGITIVVVSGEAEGSTDTPGTDPDPTPSTHTVTISKPGKGIRSVSYAEIDEDFDLETEINFTPCESDQIPVEDGTKLALKIEADTRYEIAKVKTNASEDSELSPKGEDDLSNVYVLDSVEDDMTITIEVLYTNGKKVKFFKHGEHATIKKINEDEIDNLDIDTTTEDGYSFVVEKEDDYSVDVAIYKSSTDDFADDMSSLTTMEEGVESDGSVTNEIKYTIAEDKIDGNIIVVVTDVYKVSVTHVENEIISSVQSFINGNTDNTGSDDFTVNYGDSLSVKVTLSSSLEEGQSIVVKENGSLTSSQSELGEDKTYTYNIETVTDNTEISISIETTHEVKFDEDAIPEDVQMYLNYTVIGSDEDLENIENNDSFKSYAAGAAMKVASGDKLVLKITLDDPDLVIKSITLAGKPQLPNKVSGSDYYFVLEGIEDDTSISSIDLVGVYTIKFDTERTNATIQTVVSGESGNTFENIVDNTDKAVEGSAYKFAVVTDGYSVDVKAYTTASYGTENLVPVNITDPEIDNIYTIAAEEIQGNITIVVTDTYTITFEDTTSNSGQEETSGGITGLAYKVGNAESYTDYSDAPIEVRYGESISFKFKPAEGKTIVVLENNKIVDAEENLSDEDIAEGYVVYSIPAITGNRRFTIAFAYEITDEIINEDASIEGEDITTATIDYSDCEGVITDTNVILAGRDLTFKVTLAKGYTIKEVAAYKAGGIEAESKLIPTLENDASKESDGFYSYKLTSDNIDDNIKIVVTTELIDKANYIVDFEVEGATVKINDGEPVAGSVSVTIPRTATEDADKTIKFSVTPNENYRLRYVRTDTENVEITGPDNEGIYTFMLPEKPAAVTTIYIKAEPKKTDIQLNFTGLIDNSPEAAAIASVKIVTLNEDKTNITTETIVPDSGIVATIYSEDEKVYFTVDPAAEGYTLSINASAGALSSDIYTVTVGTETESRNVTIYTLDLTNVNTNVTVAITKYVPEVDEPEEDPAAKYTLKNSIVYTPVVSNLKDTVVEAQIFDASGSNPRYDSDPSQHFNVEVINGLLYVTPRKDLDEETYLKNNTTYQLKVWLKFEKYVGAEDNGGGIWVNKPIKIKTAQVLPKVVADTKTPLNLYQSNADYTASFVVTLKDGSIGELESIEFGEKDEKARETFSIDSDVKSPDYMLVTLSLNQDGSMQYKTNSTNKIKMYVKFKNQAQNTTGTPITMTVRINN